MATDELARAAMLAAYHAACVPNDARRDRVLARLLRPGARPVLLDDRPRANKAELARAVVLAVAAAVLAVLGLELASGAPALGRLEHDRYEAIHAAPEKSEATAIERDDEVRARGVHVPQPAELPRTQPAVTPTTGEQATPVPVQRPRADATRTRPRATEAVEAFAPVDPERALLDEARAAIDRRAWREVVAALRRHAKEFPASPLADEREALHILVDCQLDPAVVERARRRGTTFVVHHPGSELSRMVIAACRQATQAAGTKVVDPFDADP